MTPQQAHDIQRCLVCAPVDCACEGACFRNARRLLELEQRIEQLRERLAAHCLNGVDGDEIANYAPTWEAPDWSAY